MKAILIKHESPEIKTAWHISDLPLNQWYEVQSQADSVNSDGEKKIYYTIKTPKGSIGWIPQSFFMTEEEWREEQINKILCK